MKRILSTSTFLVFTGVAALGVASHVFAPSEGLYAGVEAVNPPSPYECKYGEGQEIVASQLIQSTGEGAYSLTLIQPEGFETGVPAGEPIPPYIDLPCQLNRRFATCEYPEGNDVIDFTAWGFDAVVSTTVRPEENHVLWTRNDRNLSFELTTFECVGTACEIVGTFFGPEFTFPCTDFTIDKYTLTD